MAELFKAYYEGDALICGYCDYRIPHPEVLSENGNAVKLVRCPHCFKLNKVARE